MKAAKLNPFTNNWSAIFDFTKGAKSNFKLNDSRDPYFVASLAHMKASMTAIMNAIRLAVTT